MWVQGILGGHIMLAPPNEEELGGTVADKRIMEGDH